eukprot:CAMPEP_0201658070 /NCGR_PEP_ID=MMETSP0494-20130426/1093_1 /ASSEMBLY_ACC=CAM_ASM_000839 /TAXON_ID=420259 /ORGANISM="Thalassiosira gravida, Strain GMp14c1" /LENGTH=141 /DNA_ID=CAMNT_0048135013 /DNA_START=29 /DNA_END=451 /DNA_ORIENTATION=+
MSSLRLALKQSLENSTANSKSTKQQPLPFGLSDKELRRIKKAERAESKKGAGGGDKKHASHKAKSPHKDSKAEAKSRRKEKERKRLRKLKRQRRKEQQEELQRHIEKGGGTEIHLGVGEHVGVVRGLKTADESTAGEGGVE